MGLLGLQMKTKMIDWLTAYAIDYPAWSYGYVLACRFCR